MSSINFQDIDCLIVGLCNWGEEYEAHLHNLGSLFITTVTEVLVNAEFTYEAKEIDNKDFHGHYFEMLDSTRKRDLKERQTKTLFIRLKGFMNQSGCNLMNVAKKYNLSLKHVVVVYDDFDILKFNMKINQPSKSTHNGLRNIFEVLQDFYAFRIGIRPKSMKKESFSLDRYVLNDMSEQDMETFKRIFSVTAHYLPILGNTKRYCVIAEKAKSAIKRSY